MASGAQELSASRAGAPDTAGRPLPWALIAGLAGLGGLLVAGSLGLGAPWIDLRSLILVLGGTALVTFIASTREERTRTYALLRTNATPLLGSATTVRRLIELCDAMRRRGPRALDAATALRADPFGRRALELMADGLAPDELEATLAAEAATYGEGAVLASGLLRRAGDAAPALGLIGTLVGLIEMLVTLDEPSGLGQGMAIALLTTLYGAALGHVVLLPLADRIEGQAERRLQVMALLRAGARDIIAQSSPRDLERRLNAMVQPDERVKRA
ncbi:MAG: MotA/TolQ/ExbB proton channel family protein [Alphaproteobacteria bacterium]|nr:MotA/TolQ/ExbB proton channel family protein [Alphaproteobacteria bacterium]